jgi:SPP1 family predicted phage head-tail adaptor
MPTQRKNPFRPRKEAQVTQCYNDGVVIISETADAADEGRLPIVTKTEKGTLPYQERRLGLQRYYEAKQNQIRVERVIRVPKPNFEITSLDDAQTEDRKNYRIDLVQVVPDVYPPSLDLTLRVWESGSMDK